MMLGVDLRRSFEGGPWRKVIGFPPNLNLFAVLLES
jgi:hypothetical protein